MSALMHLPPRKWPLVHAAQPERMPAVDAAHYRTKKVPRSLEEAFGPGVRSNASLLHIDVKPRESSRLEGFVHDVLTPLVSIGALVALVVLFIAEKHQ